MADPPDDDQGNALNDRILDVLVYLPAGMVVTVAEEIPRLAARGRDRLGVRVSSARAVGEFVVKAGKDELVRRSDGLWRARPGHPTSTPPPARPSPSSAHGRASSAPPVRTVSPASPPATGPGGTATGLGRKRTRPRRIDTVDPRLRHPLRFPGGPAARRPQPGGAGIGSCLRGLDPGAPDHPQPGRPAPR